MTKDFAKKRRNPKPAPRSQVPGWVWLFTGLILGGFIMFLVYLSGLVPESPNSSLPSTSNKQVKKTVPDPIFEFYSMLPDSKVEVSKQSAQPNSASSQFEYILQVGSFRNSSDADRQRAQLLLLNLTAYTQVARPQGNQVWYRVLVGPFTNRSKMASARQKLLSNNMEALLLKKKL